jgi:hypothetical protein
VKISYYLLLGHFLKSVANKYIKIKSISAYKANWDKCNNKRNILSLNKEREC